MSPLVPGHRGLSAACLVFLSSGFLSNPAEAGLICWGSTGYVENADSRGRSWSGGYTMEIGVFTSGFVPDSGNREEWSGHWKALGSSPLDPVENRFAGILDTDSSAVTAGTKVWLWAKNGGDLTQGPEWVLLSGPSWVWPAASVSTAPPLTWISGEETVSLVVGRRDVGGKHLVSSAMRPVPVSQEAWLASYFQNLSTLPDDADGDGLPNSFEYLLGSDPSAPGGVSPSIQATGSTTLLKLSRNPYAESGHILEASADLIKWAPVPHQTVEDRPDLIEAAVPNDAGEPARFFRFRLIPRPEK